MLKKWQYGYTALKMEILHFEKGEVSFSMIFHARLGAAARKSKFRDHGAWRDWLTLLVPQNHSSSDMLRSHWNGTGVKAVRYFDCIGKTDYILDQIITKRIFTFIHTV